MVWAVMDLYLVCNEKEMKEVTGNLIVIKGVTMVSIMTT